jgi:hypothetical protein
MDLRRRVGNLASDFTRPHLGHNRIALNGFQIPGDPVYGFIPPSAELFGGHIHEGRLCHDAT